MGVCGCDFGFGGSNWLIVDWSWLWVCLLSVGLAGADFVASRLGLLVAGCLVWLRV